MNQDKQKSLSALLRTDQKTEAVILLILGGVWILLALGKSQERAFEYSNLLYAGRGFLIALAFILAVGSRFIKSRHLLTGYFLACMAVQSLFAILEGPRRLDYNEYVSFFVLLSTFSWNGKFSEWMKWAFPPVAVCLVTPFFFKDPQYFTSVGKFVFTFTTPVCIVFLAIIVAKINSAKFKAVSENIRLQNELVQEERKKNVALAELSLQIAHDIRAPLAALNVIMNDLEQLPEESRFLAREATRRIQGIAEGLLKKGKTQENASNSISKIARPLISEKKAQFKDRKNLEILDKITDTNCLVKAHPLELGRVLSNLIDNAIEATDGRSEGQIVVSASEIAENIEIEVTDNGVGIPAQTLAKLGRKGVSFGKRTGNGLGLFHARQFAEGQGGRLTIRSKIGDGTSVLITLPKALA